MHSKGSTEWGWALAEAGVQLGGVSYGVVTTTGEVSFYFNDEARQLHMGC
jgi:hypothetical protein